MITPDGTPTPYSQLPTHILKGYDEVPPMFAHQRDPDMGDTDFNRRYAMILLRERCQ